MKQLDMNGDIWISLTLSTESMKLQNQNGAYVSDFKVKKIVKETVLFFCFSSDSSTLKISNYDTIKNTYFSTNGFTKIPTQARVDPTKSPTRSPTGIWIWCFLLSSNLVFGVLVDIHTKTHRPRVLMSILTIVKKNYQNHKKDGWHHFSNIKAECKSLFPRINKSQSWSV